MTSKRARLVVAVGAAMAMSGAGGAASYAAVSGAWDGTDGAGSIDACFTTHGQMRLVNTAAGDSCTGAETAISWSKGGSNGSNVLGLASNPGPVTAPVMSTDGSAAKPVASVSFTVPAGHNYQIQMSAQAVVTQEGGSCAGTQTTYSGGALALFADGDYAHNLLGFQGGGLPGGAVGGSQVVVLGPGTHTAAIVNAPSVCSSVADPGTASVSDAFLSVNLLGQF